MGNVLIFSQFRYNYPVILSCLLQCKIHVDLVFLAEFLKQAKGGISILSCEHFLNPEALINIK